MLRSADGLRGSSLQAIDGEIGKVDDLYFDDSGWRVRYLVANTGSWLSGRRVLLSPLAVTGTPKHDGQVLVNLTTDQVRNSPEIDAAQPVSRQQEIELHNHYGWNYYGFPSGINGIHPVPAVLPRDGAGADRPRDPHLRSVREVTGYQIRATDAELGHVEDLIVDVASWQIRYMVVDTAALWLGRKVLISPRSIREVDWSRQAVDIALSEDEIKQAPEWDGEVPVDPEYDEKLSSHYRGISYVV